MPQSLKWRVIEKDIHACTLTHVKHTYISHIYTWRKSGEAQEGIWDIEDLWNDLHPNAVHEEDSQEETLVHTQDI